MFVESLFSVQTNAKILTIYIQGASTVVSNRILRAMLADHIFRCKWHKVAKNGLNLPKLSEITWKAQSGPKI